jgi:uncharacterized protein (TIGR00251 family)
VRVRAQPKASRTELAGEHGAALRIRVAAPPVDGEANRELLRFVSRLCHVPASRLKVVAGQSSRNKVIEIAGVTVADVRRSLAG